MPKSLLAFVDETRAWVKSDAGTACVEHASRAWARQTVTLPGSHANYRLMTLDSVNLQIVICNEGYKTVEDKIEGIRQVKLAIFLAEVSGKHANTPCVMGRLQHCANTHRAAFSVVESLPVTAQNNSSTPQIKTNDPVARASLHERFPTRLLPGGILPADAPWPLCRSQ
jgi:hypothetical protein